MKNVQNKVFLVQDMFTDAYCDPLETLKLHQLDS